MTPEQFTEEMRKLNTGDEEADHSAADALLCRVLKELGYEEGVLIYQSIDKWYA